MLLSAPHDGFRLAYIDSRPDAPEATPTILLVHGWPGDSTDYRHVLPRLEARWRVIVPDLRGFGQSDKHLLNPDAYYGAQPQAEALIALLDQIGVQDLVIGGYDIGSRVAQLMARRQPDRVKALVLAPPLPGAGSQILEADIAAETWYLPFQRSPLAVPLIDGRPDAVDLYLRYFWDRWSGPHFDVDTPEMTALIGRYSSPGAFEAAINWYRAGDGYVHDTVSATPPAPHDRIAIPTHVVWQDGDRIYPRRWAAAVHEFFSHVTFHEVDGVGHFVPLEAPEEFAGALRQAVDSSLR